MIDLVPLGDRAYLARFPNEADARRWASAVEASRVVAEVVLAYRSVGVYLDPSHPDFDQVEGRLLAIPVPRASEEATSGPLVRLPVVYDGEDLEDVARRLGLTAEAVIAAHSDPTYDVFAVGFLPGFPYAGYLPETLSGLPRREVPRVRVPAGSVAIAGRQTGVYPRESPGGWHLIGRTVVPLADPEVDVFPIRAGMRIAFQPVPAEAFPAWQDEFRQFHGLSSKR